MVEQRYIDFVWKNINYALSDLKEAGSSEEVDRSIEFLEIQLDELKGILALKQAE